MGLFGKRKPTEAGVLEALRRVEDPVIGLGSG